MYKLYTWYPWEFGRWVYRGEAEDKKTLLDGLSNQSRTTYKVVKDGVVEEYHEAPECFTRGRVRPKPLKVGDPDFSE